MPESSTPITFVTFYLNVTDQTMATIHETTSTITVTEPHRYIRTMFDSAKRFHPECRLVILSDMRTRFPAYPAAEIIRYELDPKNPMMSRSIAWLNYLRRADGHVIFLDSDILINGDLSHVFADDFAVCFTYRDGDAKWPINAGINFAHGRQLGVAADFHARWLERYKAAHQDYSVWGGDQDTLRELFANVDFARDDCFTQRFGDCDIRFVPCATYNFSTKIAEDMQGRYPDARVLHFKGRRKPFMLPYWRAHILGEKEAIRRVLNERIRRASPQRKRGNTEDTER